MRQTEQKALDYLKSNPIVANFIKKVNAERKKYYKKINLSSKEPDLIVEIGNKFIRYGKVLLVGDSLVELMEI
jgi:hypothetical protein